MNKPVSDRREDLKKCRMALRSLTAEELEPLRELLTKWGKSPTSVSRSELEVIRPIIGEEKYEWTLSLLGVRSWRRSRWGFRAEYLYELKDYAEVYQRSPRQIKRWIRAGRYATPPDMPPLDDRGQMLAWWQRMMISGELKQKPPVILEQFAIEQAKGDGPVGGRLSSIDVRLLKVVEGIALEQARGFLAATAHQLEEAYQKGQDALIGRVQARWEKALGAVRLAEDSERKAARARGNLLSKHEVILELTQLIEMLRNMQSTMGRRIIARLGNFLELLNEVLAIIKDPTLPAEIVVKLEAAIARVPSVFEAKLNSAIEAERARECAALRRAKYFGSTEEVILELDQAATAAA